MVARGFQSASHPILAQIVPIRRCNLSCTYCNEYDKTRTPSRRSDDARAHRPAGPELRTGDHRPPAAASRRCTGPRRAHPARADEPARSLDDHQRIPPQRPIASSDCNDAGLDYLQISIDNVQPDDVSKKSLKVLDAKLRCWPGAARSASTSTRCWARGLEPPRGRSDRGRSARDRPRLSRATVGHDPRRSRGA